VASRGSISLAQYGSPACESRNCPFNCARHLTFEVCRCLERSHVRHVAADRELDVFGLDPQRTLTARNGRQHTLYEVVVVLVAMVGGDWGRGTKKSFFRAECTLPRRTDASVRPVGGNRATRPCFFCPPHPNYRATKPCFFCPPHPINGFGSAPRRHRQQQGESHPLGWDQPDARAAHLRADGRAP
jgi:hypothetical protein